MAAADPVFDDALDAFANAALGGGLPPRAEALIAEAGQLRHQPERAQPLLERACSIAPHHPAPLIALYRLYFYGHQLARARAVGEAARDMARVALGPTFGARPLDQDAARHDAAVRFYLFSVKGLAYLNLRLGELDRARALLRELRALDPDDHVGGALLHHVLARHEAREEDGEVDMVSAHPARGWAGAQP